MLSLSIGLPFVLPGAGTIPTGRGQLKVLDALWTCMRWSQSERHERPLEWNDAYNPQSLLSVPSIVEDLLTIPGGVDALKRFGAHSRRRTIERGNWRRVGASGSQASQSLG